jgi:P27 family predicted phage terminase small subunit
LSKAARAEWDRLAPQLFAAGVLTELDAQAVAAWAETLVKYHEANRALARHGILVDGASGGLAVNPAQRVAKDCLAAMQRFQAEFGATPSARMRVTAQPAPPEMDAFDKFLAERPD